MKCTITSDGSEKQILAKNYSSVKRKTKELITQLLEKGYNEFYINCEYGIPLIAGEIICQLKTNHSIKLHIVVPYEEQCSSWSKKARDKYYLIHQASDTVTFAEKRYTEECYKAADVIMADNSDYIAVFAEKNYVPYISEYAKYKNISFEIIET
ncbi:MAG: SLOG family protein [Ruminiclostridium sp.]